MCFLVIDGLQQLEEEDAVWSAMREEEWRADQNQVFAIHKVADRLL